MFQGSFWLPCFLWSFFLSTARYDDRLLSLDRLFGKMILDGEDPEDPDLQAHPKVFLQESNNRLVETPLVPFGN